VKNESKVKMSAFKRLLDKGRDVATDALVYDILPVH
jgi:hypothetical protein